MSRKKAIHSFERMAFLNLLGTLINQQKYYLYKEWDLLFLIYHNL